MSVDAVSILPYMQACRLMMVRLQTSYRSRILSLRRQCLMCGETPEVFFFFFPIFSLLTINFHSIPHRDVQYRLRENRERKATTGHTRSCSSAGANQQRIGVESAFRSDGARGIWTENDRVDTRPCFLAMSLTITQKSVNFEPRPNRLLLSATFRSVVAVSSQVRRKIRQL